MRFTSSTWADLPWTEWIRFSDARAFKRLPPSAGVYRVRPVGAEELFYIGETGRDLRERLRDLRSNTLQEAMPFNDPHTARDSYSHHPKSPGNLAETLKRSTLILSATSS